MLQTDYENSKDFHADLLGNDLNVIRAQARVLFAINPSLPNFGDVNWVRRNLRTAKALWPRIYLTECTTDDGKRICGPNILASSFEDAQRQADARGLTLLGELEQVL